MKLLIKGAEIIDPAGKNAGRNDILVEDGVIREIGKPSAAGAEVLDASGLKAAPGLVDIHVHFRDPGYEYKENVATGLRAASAGGFTSVVCMPNTKPDIDTKSVAKYVNDKARAAGLGRLFIAGAISKKREGAELAEIGDMMNEGIVAVTDDGNPVMNAQLMRRALEYTKMFGIPVMSHAEDKNLAGAGVMNEGMVSTTIGMRPIPKEAETVMVLRDIELAALTGGRLHLTHISSAESVDAVRRAKARGLRVTCDVTPHHLVLTDESVMGFDTATKVNPPLRDENDRQALIAGLLDGTIDAIASDHAPHAVHEKEVSYDDAPFGLVGLETTLAVLVTRLVETGAAPLELLISKLTSGPAAVLGLNAGALAPGAPADIVLFDPAAEWTVDASKFFSKGRNCPFNGWRVRGKVAATVAAGKVVFKDGAFV
ncbi:MAG TPA: dihydroorotase [bacterium]|nr:MAG: Dihydroorotase [bacterium ADurb.Bin236]HPI76844.1 dihydroorotase [bacterium]HPN94608.1 dihydroorotase [bacterium]